ncbi:hypothetical protein DXA91_03650 [Clostridium sp. OF09-10]|nr:hypothetical protein DXA91_03650 [Clostridium sp. OF09-10]
MVVVDFADSECEASANPVTVRGHGVPVYCNKKSGLPYLCSWTKTKNKEVGKHQELKEDGKRIFRAVSDDQRRSDDRVPCCSRCSVLSDPCALP